MTTNSLPTMTSLQNLIASWPSDKKTIFTHKIGAYEIKLEQSLLTMRNQHIPIPESVISNIPSDFVLSVETLPKMEIPVYPAAEPPLDDHAAHDLWTTNKASWEQLEQQKLQETQEKAEVLQLKHVLVRVPVMLTHRAWLDEKKVHVYHTLRGPIMGQVLSEDNDCVTLYSPCFLDPNVQTNRVHYLPLAFAGFEFTLYRNTCIGSSVPQETEVCGYPRFIECNKAGDYAFRSKAAYHYVEAQNEDTPLVSESTLSCWFNKLTSA